MTRPAERYMHTQVAVTQDVLRGVYGVEVRLEQPDGLRETLHAGVFATREEAVAFADVLHARCCELERANKGRAS
jgi:hypothetical protein